MQNSHISSTLYLWDIFLNDDLLKYTGSCTSLEKKLAIYSPMAPSPNKLQGIDITSHQMLLIRPIDSEMGHRITPNFS